MNRRLHRVLVFIQLRVPRYADRQRRDDGAIPRAMDPRPQRLDRIPHTSVRCWTRTEGPPSKSSTASGVPDTSRIHLEARLWESLGARAGDGGSVTNHAVRLTGAAECQI
jgi:hypothetical protein